MYVANDVTDAVTCYFLSKEFLSFVNVQNEVLVDDKMFLSSLLQLVIVSDT